MSRINKAQANEIINIIISDLLLIVEARLTDNQTEISADDAQQEIDFLKGVLLDAFDD